MTYWVVVYADEREIDKSRIQEALNQHPNHVTLLRTGVGKVRSTIEVNSYLTGALRKHEPRPKIINVGTCASVVPGLSGKLVSPSRAIDRDATPELLKQVGIKSQPALELESFNNSGLIIGSGDGFVSDEYEAYRLREMGVSLVDMETHAVAWTAMRNLTGKILSLRYVTNSADTHAVHDWSESIGDARESLTTAVLQLVCREAVN